MRSLSAAALLLSLCTTGLGQKKPKQPDVEVVESHARRDGDRILIDGRLRVTAEKPLRGLIVIFDLLSPENGVLASETAVLEEESAAPGEERSYHSATSDHARAVRYQVRAQAKGERELRVAKAGPFPIE